MSAKVLIADDEQNILISLEFLMKREGYQVRVAHDGQEAVDAVAKDKPNLMLLDAMMPKKTGFEVCQEIRSNPDNADIIILMLTAKGRDTDMAKGIALGANAYMVKPFSTKELAQKVRDLLGTAA